jgi:hypothetical protein
VSNVRMISKDEARELYPMEVGRFENFSIIETGRPRFVGPAVRELFANAVIYSQPWPAATRKAAAWCRLRHYLKAGKVRPLDSFMEPRP